MDIRAFLAEHGIEHTWFDHPAVFTCEESADLPEMPGADTKNLFLRDEKEERFFLVSVPHEKRVDLKALRHALGTRPLTFGSPEELQTMLGVTPGSVTIIGLINDHDRRMDLIIDQSLWDAPAICCHPLVNTATIVLEHDQLVKFLSATGHEARVMTVPEKSEQGRVDSGQ